MRAGLRVRLDPEGVRRIAPHTQFHRHGKRCGTVVRTTIRGRVVVRWDGLRSDREYLPAMLRPCVDRTGDPGSYGDPPWLK